MFLWTEKLYICLFFLKQISIWELWLQVEIFGYHLHSIGEFPFSLISGFIEQKRQFIAIPKTNLHLRKETWKQNY